jgi:putative membrane protein
MMPGGSTNPQPGNADNPYGSTQPTGQNPGGMQEGPGGMQNAPYSTGAQGAPAAQPQTGQNVMPPNGVGSQGMAGQPGATGQPGAAPGAGGTSTDVSALDDAQLAAVLQAINTTQVQAAQVAVNKATSPEVKRFAHQMLNVHRDMQSQANAMFRRLQLVPSDNAISNQLRSDAQNELSMLHGEHGKDFDRAYVDAQVRDHNKVLELFDRMIPNAKSPELRADLQSDRAKIETHLRDAERAQQSLEQPPQKGTTNKQRGGTSPY